MQIFSDDPIVSAFILTTAAYVHLSFESLNGDPYAHQIEYRPVSRAKFGLDDLHVSNPTDIKTLPARLRRSLINEMAEHFTALWGNTDPSLCSRETSARTLSTMADDPSAVFLVQHDRVGKLVSTASIAQRDIPAFNGTGPLGRDRYGDHWIINVFSVHRGLGFATEQIASLQKIAYARRWPYLWLYCKDEQDGLCLPDYYRNKLGFEVVGHEYVIEDSKIERENIMRFDTRAHDFLEANRWAAAAVPKRPALAVQPSPSPVADLETR